MSNLHRRKCRKRRTVKFVICWFRLVHVASIKDVFYFYMYAYIIKCRYSVILPRIMHKIIQYDNYIVSHLNVVIRNENRQYKRPGNSGLCLIHFHSVYDIFLYPVHDGWIYSVVVHFLVFLLCFCCFMNIRLRNIASLEAFFTQSVNQYGIAFSF